MEEVGSQAPYKPHNNGRANPDHWACFAMAKEKLAFSPLPSTVFFIKVVIF